jgi:hypothetical protein
MTESTLANGIKPIDLTDLSFRKAEDRARAVLRAHPAHGAPSRHHLERLQQLQQLLLWTFV